MYSRSKRMRAIELYIKYDHSAADVIHELSYPDRKTLAGWYGIYLKEQESGVLWDRYSRCPKYSLEQKVAAVEHYLEHGRNLSRTVRALGYPSRETLRDWCKELSGTRRRRVGGIQYTQEQKKKSVIALCTRTGSAKDVAREYGVTREVLYNWKNDLLGKGDSIALTRKKDKPLPDDRDTLLSEIDSLKRQIHRLKLEKDILERTAETLKKPGCRPEEPKK